MSEADRPAEPLGGAAGSGYGASMDASDERRPGADALLRRVARDFAGDPDEALRAFEEGIRALEKDAAPSPEVRVRLWARAGQLAVFSGRIDQALRRLYDALAIADDGYVALQLGNALHWYGDTPSIDEAEGHFDRALAHARRARDGTLAISALCGRGEVWTWRGRPDRARAAFGEALGITEFSPGDGPTIAPLAGLATAHAEGGVTEKAARLAERALERALRVGDAAGEARARMAAARIMGDAAELRRAAEAAERAPHRPLALRARVHAWRLDPDEPERVRLLAAVRDAGMRGDAAALAPDPGRGGRTERD